MDDSLSIGALGWSISVRLGIASEYQKKMQEQQEKDTKLRQQLLETAPKVLRKWLEDDLALTSVMTYGKYSGKVSVGDSNLGLSSLRTYKAMKQSFDELAKAWRGVVAVELDENHGGRIEIRLSAVMLMMPVSA